MLAFFVQFMFLFFQFKAKMFVSKSSSRQASTSFQIDQSNLNSNLIEQQYQSVLFPKLEVQVPLLNLIWALIQRDFASFSMDPFQTSQVHMSLLQRIHRRRALLHFLLLDQFISVA
jgi:hypothetical protein